MRRGDPYETLWFMGSKTNDKRPCREAFFMQTSIITASSCKRKYRQMWHTGLARPTAWNWVIFKSRSSSSKEILSIVFTIRKPWGCAKKSVKLISKSLELIFVKNVIIPLLPQSVWPGFEVWEQHVRMCQRPRRFIYQTSGFSHSA